MIWVLTLGLGGCANSSDERGAQTGATTGHPIASGAGTSGGDATGAGTNGGGTNGANTGSNASSAHAGSTGATAPVDGGSVGGIAGGRVGVGTTIAGCAIFPSDNPWNVRVDGPDVQVVHTYDAELVPSRSLHPDFGDWSKNHDGIPFNTVDAGQPDEPTTFSLYASQSDPGPGGWVGANPVTANGATGSTAYPFFVGMHIEGDPPPGGQPGRLPGDQHAIVLQQETSGCTSWEAWNCVVATAPPFDCANGARFDLSSNALRPAGWTSGDLAGLSILAGLVRMAEVKAGAVTHAIRVTFSNTQSGYIPPATHAVSPGSGAGPLGSAYPPMGLRLRLKAGVPTSSYAAPSQAIMAAMKTYGLIVADIGSDWYFQGDSDDGWAAMAPDGAGTFIDEIVGDFEKLSGSDFEAVYSGDPVSTGL
jgi:hypothetical protein